MGLDKDWSPKLVTANQLISDNSRNKFVANNSWFTVCKCVRVNIIKLV